MLIVCDHFALWVAEPSSSCESEIGNSTPRTNHTSKSLGHFFLFSKGLFTPMLLGSNLYYEKLLWTVFLLKVSVSIHVSEQFFFSKNLKLTSSFSVPHKDKARCTDPGQTFESIFLWSLGWKPARPRLHRHSRHIVDHFHSLEVPTTFREGL